MSGAVLYQPFAADEHRCRPSLIIGIGITVHPGTTVRCTDCGIVWVWRQYTRELMPSTDAYGGLYWRQETRRERRRRIKRAHP